MMHYRKLVANPILFLVILVGSWIFVPQIAQADTVELNLSIERQPNESYGNLLQRAKVFLITATQQKFSQAVHATNVSVIVVGQNYGAVVPVLSLQVSRPQWLSQKAICQKYKFPCFANILNQVRYYNDAQLLLGFKDKTSKTSTELEAANQEALVSPEFEDKTDIDRESAEAIVPVDIPEASHSEP